MAVVGELDSARSAEDDGPLSGAIALLTVDRRNVVAGRCPAVLVRSPQTHSISHHGPAGSSYGVTNTSANRGVTEIFTVTLCPPLSSGRGSYYVK